MHPLGKDNTKLTDTELNTKIEKLTGYLYSVTDFQLGRQIKMVLDDLLNERQRRYEEEMNEANKKINNNILDKIDIKR